MMPKKKHFEHLNLKLGAIKIATNDFAEDKCIGRGGFGKVYKGELLHSKGETIVAIKRLDRKYGQGNPEFWKEIIMLSQYKHENIVSLLGFCDENDEKILVYEYASKASLDLYLDNDELTWIRRLKICIGAACGLAYLHNPGGTHQRVLHRDIKSSNILLDENWNARISDLGLAKFGPANQQYTFLISHTVGTIGYCDPLYVETGLLTKKSDVYSFGVVLFEILCGRLCIGVTNDKRLPLISLVRQYYKANKINELVYSNIQNEINPKSLEAYTTIAYQCLNKDHEERPLMTEVVRKLGNALEYQEFVKIAIEPENLSLPVETTFGTKSEEANIKVLSMTELFTPEQIQEHISSLRQWVGQTKAKGEKNQALGHTMYENFCQLCAVEKLTFESPPIYCTPCGCRIKRNAMFYTVGTGDDTRRYFCIPCYNEAGGDTIGVDATYILKARLEKKKNNEEAEEWWVRCEICGAYQHQICALFNRRRNGDGRAKYTCPNCYVEKVERGERKTLPESALLGAKDLPRTMLSDHIETRLFGRLMQERHERARVHGKSYDEVPGAESLVVRVVSSVDKKLEVKQRFLEMFQDENYPVEFGYKSKVILLFQKIEGVKVCLFGMYAQEFGAECEEPNHRHVYLSYMDSVKYFRPEIRAITGEALRTFVYHEILIGYLEYCKLRGFTSCYILACPPSQGEDYIFYCHPEIQKTPKSDKLREWYLSMLRKASRESIVVGVTNLYDHFFVSSGECKAKVNATRLPYFDGDYWSCSAEEIIYQIRQEEEGRKTTKGLLVQESMKKGALKASDQTQTDLSGNTSKDILMRRLGESISPMKEHFIMVHLQHACTHCCILMVSGNRWVCNQCKKFQICNKCYEIEQKLEDRERHPLNHHEKHCLYPIEINDVPVDTKDKDEILESEYFDEREAFLSLCQGNHYQYDTLRRAKHSSMMVLYHLHNPTEPSFVATCYKCHNDIETTQCWRCVVCPDFDICKFCTNDHPHKLIPHVSIANDAQNEEARQQRFVQLRKMLDFLVHASQCRSLRCQYPNCRKVKGLLRHGINCETRASGGCVLCTKMWYLVQLHARACEKSQCHVPRCRDLKKRLRRLQQQSDNKRRRDVWKMMRQRAVEVDGYS